VWVAGGLVAVKQSAPIFVRSVGQRAVNEKGTKKRHASGRHLKRYEPPRVKGARVHFSAAEVVRSLTLLFAVPMAARRDFKATLLHIGVVEEDHCGRHPRRYRRHVGPIGIVLVQPDGTAPASALQVELLGEKIQFVSAYDILAWVD
jgi:hypothetical protein